MEEATASSAPRLSLSSLSLPLSSLSPSPSLLSLFRTSDASSPLFVVVSLVSLSLRKLKGFDRVFGCVVWAMQRFRTRLRGELDTSHPETLVWLREGAAVLHGLSAPPESSSGLRRLSRTGEEEGDGGGDDDWRLWPPPQHRGCLSLLSLSSPLSLSSLSLSLAPLMSPLLSSSLYLVSLCASTAGFDRVFRVWGVGYVAVQDALARGSRHSTSRDSSVVAGGRSGAVRAAGAAGDPRRARLDRRANGV